MRTTMFMCAVLVWSGVANAIVVLNDGRDDYLLNSTVFSNETIEVRDSSSGDGTTLTLQKHFSSARNIDVFGSSRVVMVQGTIDSRLSLNGFATGQVTGGAVYGSIIISGSASLDLSRADVDTLQIEDDGRAVVNSTNIDDPWGYGYALAITASGFGSQVDIFGGKIGKLSISDSAVVNLHGGVMGSNADWRLYDTATLNIYGLE